MDLKGETFILTQDMEEKEILFRMNTQTPAVTFLHCVFVSNRTRNLKQFYLRWKLLQYAKI